MLKNKDKTIWKLCHKAKLHSYDLQTDVREQTDREWILGISNEVNYILLFRMHFQNFLSHKMGGEKEMYHISSKLIHWINIGISIYDF
jgi:DNA-binding PadR family transcriptional regulator